jgi:hypothetical protein
MDEGELIEKIRRASDEEYVTEWSKEGKISVQKKKSEIKRGKKARSSGAQFELEARKDLEEKGWIVCKWTNNIDLEKNKIVSAKRKFNPFSKAMTIGTGFPDFIAFKKMNENFFKVIGVEVKLSGVLDREEKEKCRWYIENNIFNEFILAKKSEGRIIYLNVDEILERMR